MKKLIVLFLLLCLVLSGCQSALTKAPGPDTRLGGNYTDEMKIPYGVDLD